MAEIGLRARMLVRDVMSSPVITVNEETTANHVAELMNKHGLGCIIVTNKEGKPIGIITERDLVTRVLAKNLKPDSLKAKDVMTSPLITIEPSETISEAARKMSRLNIRRLGVVYKGQLIGLVSSKDILGVMPELIETIQEKALMEGENMAQTIAEEESSLAGYCDRCGGWSENLRESNGEFLCEDCRAELESEE
ncbi:MAG: CBS domain-containing protein [Candidatus Bathyarchaeota archaeon]|nr:CBS domain-containing protein [Candidatus Bathyarchaeota archaeon A05DMB-3]MDH7606200.1 CBS domain-containing protein [Candidatus Bathyarchaeota archaeon]